MRTDASCRCACGGNSFGPWLRDDSQGRNEGAGPAPPLEEWTETSHLEASSPCLLSEGVFFGPYHQFWRGHLQAQAWGVLSPEACILSQLPGTHVYNLTCHRYANP